MNARQQQATNKLRELRRKREDALALVAELDKEIEVANDALRNAIRPEIWAKDGTYLGQ
jgi:hypothetical protein